MDVSQAGANRRGIICLVTGMAAFAINDALIKLVALHAPVGEAIFLRGLFTLGFLALALIAMRQFGMLRLALRPLVTLRGILDGFASALFVLALVHMNIAELAAVVLTSPLLMTAMAVMFYGELVGWRRWIAIAVGLVGMLFIVKPTAGAFDVWALLGLGAAAASASRDLITRRLDAAIPALAVSFIGSIGVTLSGGVIGLNESWRALSQHEMLLLLGAATFISIGTYLLVLAFRGVEISLVAPFRYTLLIWGGIAGYLAFGERPDIWSVVGAALIVGSGLYTLHREAVRRRVQNSGTPPAC
jgi:drug/metabolite transporter (DMT)-like permease